MADPKRFVKIELDAKSAKLLRKVQENLGQEKLQEALLKLFNKQASLIAGHISKNLLSGQLLKARTGALRRSIVGRGEIFNGVPVVRVGIFRGPSLAYAALQEFGTKGYDSNSPFEDIKPVKAKALAIPQGPALTRAGVHRYTSPREYPRDLVFIPFRRGNAVGGLYDKASLSKAGGELDNAKLVYLLVRKVRIKPKQFLKNGMLQKLPALAEAVGTEMVRLLQGKGSDE